MIGVLATASTDYSDAISGLTDAVAPYGAAAAAVAGVVVVAYVVIGWIKSFGRKAA